MKKHIAGFRKVRRPKTEAGSNEMANLERDMKMLQERVDDKNLVLLRGCSAELASKVREDIREIENEIDIIKNRIKILKNQ